MILPSAKMTPVRRSRPAQVDDFARDDVDFGAAELRLHGRTVEPTVGLSAWTLYRRALSPVQKTKLNACGIGNAPH